MAENVPALQLLGASLPVAQKEPAGHVVQSLWLKAPIVLRKLPALQGSAALEPWIQ